VAGSNPFALVLFQAFYVPLSVSDLPPSRSKFLNANIWLWLVEPWRRSKWLMSLSLILEVINT
jgi:hypothetical protein